MGAPMDQSGRIVVFAATTRRRSRLLLALAKSAHKSGTECVISNKMTYQECDVAVVWGLPKPLDSKRKKASDRQRLLNEIFSIHKGETVVFEAPVFGRRIVPKELRPWWVKSFFPANAFWSRLLLPERLYSSDPYKHCRIGLGGFPDDGAMALADFSKNRWEKLNGQLSHLSVKPWRKSGSQVVVIGQVPGDASLRGLDVVDWIYRTCVELRELTNRPIIVRPHPLAGGEVSSLLGLKLAAIDVTLDDVANPLSKTLDSAWAIVTYSSGAAIDAILSGIPAIAMSPASFAWDVANHTLESVIEPSLPDRGPWLEKLAAIQWSEKEVEDGDVWEPLLKAIFAARTLRLKEKTSVPELAREYAL